MRTLITCHRNADFDAVASLIGAAVLYPDAVLLYPGSQERTLQGFYEGALRYLYNFRNVKEIDFAAIERLVVVDTRQAERIPHVAELLARPDLEIHVWDHHRDQVDPLPAGLECVDDVASTCTLLVEEIRNRDLGLGCEDATVLGLGIYGDTGAFTFSSTTVRDLEATTWLLSQGMDINIIAGLVRQDMTREQLRALNDLLESAELHDLGGSTMAIAVTHFDDYLNDFATLAPRFMEMQPCDIFFGLGAMEDKIQVVARSRTESLDVGAICVLLGGGGHRYAASATVRDMALPEIRDFILTQVAILANPDQTAGRIMSSPVVGIEENDPIRKAESIMSRYGLKAMPVFRPHTRICTGWIDQQLTLRAISHGLGEVPTAAYMQRNFQVVSRAAGLQTLMDIIVGARQRLVPVVDSDDSSTVARPQSEVLEKPEALERVLDQEGDSDLQRALKQHPLAGVVTRTDLIRLFMDDDSGAQLPQPRQRAQRQRNLAKAMRVRIPAPGMDLLERAGRMGTRMGVNVYVVGGFVRDLLMDQRGKHWPNMDIDLVVEGDAIAFAHALAEELRGRVREHREFMTALILFPASSIKSEKGAKFGKTVRPNDVPDQIEPAQAEAENSTQELRVDVATARLEYYTSPAALPTVELSSIRMDLDRRDFTINAMAVQLNKEYFGLLVDFFDGQGDIKQKRIRMLHALSFVEDPTRALRAVRFEQRYKFRIGPQCDRLMRNALDLQLMDKLSGSRILHELELMLEEANPLACFVRMQEFDMLAAIHPLLALPPWKVDILDKSLRALDWYRRLYLPEQPDDLFLFLLAICRNSTSQELHDVLQRLDLAANRREALLGVRSAVIEALPQVEAWHAQAGPPSRLHEILGRMPLEGLLYLTARMEQEDLHKTLSQYIYQGRLEKGDISGADLQALGLKPGPAYSRILKQVLAAKLDGIVPTREAQLEMAADLVHRLEADHNSDG